jgi:transposase
VSHGSSRRLSRGDRRRNDKLARLREVVTRDSAVLAFDLASSKQVCALIDQDSQVLGRRTVNVKAWQLHEAVEWGLAKAAAAGFASLVVACEPTGHRWRVLDQIAAGLGVRLVCVQPMLVKRARESEDLTRNKNDDVDAMIIGRLVTELRCYLPERADPTWARLRHLGARRIGLVTDITAVQQQIVALLECAWPAALDTAADPLNARNWLGAVTVVLDRVGLDGDLNVIGRWGWTRFQTAVRRELTATGTRWNARIVQAVFDAATDPDLTVLGVPEQRAGVFERVQFLLADLTHARAELAAVESRMVAVLTELQLLELLISIPGVAAVGAATILAETGDLTRFGSARALVKHAGLCPRDNASGTYQGNTRISGRGRPELRLAAWRATYGALLHNPVLKARHAHLTSRVDNKLSDTQARVAVAASLLRQLHAVVTTRTAWDPAIAAGLDRPADTQEATAAA